MSVTQESLGPLVRTDDVAHVMLTSAGPHLSARNRDDDVMLTIMRSFADSEENWTDEDLEYREEYGDDYTKGATSHPTS